MIPPPTPVPSVSITRWSAGGSGTSWASARAAQLASLSTNTGMPSRVPSSSRSGTPSSGMFTLESTVPVSNSTWDGTPMPAASAGPAASVTSATTCSMPASSALGVAQVGGALELVHGLVALDQRNRDLGAAHVDAQDLAHGPFCPRLLAGCKPVVAPDAGGRRCA